MKQTCAKCDKAGGIAMCNGCQRSFCIKHFVEHRQELSQQMDEIAQSHDLLRQGVNSVSNADSLVKQIDLWEKESIEKIQAHARKIRHALFPLFEQRQNELKLSLNKLTNELRTCRESDDFTELDMNRWMRELARLRRMTEDSIQINIERENDAKSLIGLIKVTLPEQSSMSMDVDNDRTSRERFDEIHGDIRLSADGLVGCCTNNFWGGSYMSGINRYSYGTHEIHFRIEQKWSNYLFFGIITASEKFTQDSSKMKSKYGWWELNYIVSNGIASGRTSEQTIQAGDKLTLILHCARHLIQLKHHRIDRCVEIPVDLQHCPFPWKILVRLDTNQDCVRLVD